jgi:hypothetical protein
MSKKTDLPGTVDPELAILAGASATFQPLGGRILALIPRGKLDIRIEEILVKALSSYGNAADRLTIALYKRPFERGIALVYLILIHCITLLLLV